MLHETLFLLKIVLIQTTKNKIKTFCKPNTFLDSLRLY